MDYKIRLTYTREDKVVVQKILLGIIKYAKDGMYYMDTDELCNSTIWVSEKNVKKVRKYLQAAKSLGINYQIVGAVDC